MTDHVTEGRELENKGGSTRSCMQPSMSMMPNEAPNPMALPFEAIGEEVTCPICLEFLKNPVNVDCGHNFCQECLTTCCESVEGHGNFSCPVCRANIQKEHFRPNLQLANLIEHIKLLPGEEVFCKIHKEKLNLFCKEDEELLCVFCEHSTQHQSHTVLLLEKAVQDYKDRIQCRLQILRKEKEKVTKYEGDTEKESQYLLRQIQAARVKMVAEFRQFHQFLIKREKLLLAQMEEVEKEITRERDEHLARFSSKISSLESLTQEMEEKHQQPANKLLQDIKGILQRWEKEDTFINPGTVPSALKLKICDFSDRSHYLECVIKKFKETIALLPPLQKANVILDPDTAHPNLILSEDGKDLRESNKVQAVLRSPKRFTTYASVLGCEGFTGGRHTWEVTVGNEGFWAMGVARESVKRKEYIEFTPKDGIWAIERWEENYKASYTLCSAPPPLSRESEKIRVILNYDGGHVAFFDADTADLLLAFSEASFCGETLLPFFYVFGNAHLRLLP